MAMVIQKMRKTEIGYVENKNQRQVTFSKRRFGLFKKASEISVLTGAALSILVFSPSGRPFSFFSSSLSSSLDPLLDAFLSGTGVDAVATQRRHLQQLQSTEIQLLTNEISELERQLAMKRAAKKIKKTEPTEAGWRWRPEESGIGGMTTRASLMAELTSVEMQLEVARLRIQARLEEMGAKKQDPINCDKTEMAQNPEAAAVSDRPFPPQDPSSSCSANWLSNVGSDKLWAKLEFSDYDHGVVMDQTELPSDDDTIASLLFDNHNSCPPDLASLFS